MDTETENPPELDHVVERFHDETAVGEIEAVQFDRTETGSHYLAMFYREG